MERKNKKLQNIKKTSAIPFHLDDKGRRVFDFSKTMIIESKKEQDKVRRENLVKNTIDSEFKCEKCDMIFTDNIAYKNHLNGKKHNAVIGNDMKVKQSTVESVRERLLMKKREREKANEAKKKK